jgi:catechol 2,3-dioxygenase
MSIAIDPETTVGPVSLTVPDLDRSIAFYSNALGLVQNRRENGSAWLGAGGVDLLELVEQPDTRLAPGHTGLYHVAIRVPSRPALARSLRRLANTQTPISGVADHLVSEAIYLEDPDGNGIEIYRDRPREDWTWFNGSIQMATLPLDLDELVSELDGDRDLWAEMEPGTTVGHVHLKVSSIPETETFYHDVLGFDLVARYGPMASFLSAGGYHHHIGTNTWESNGASPPPPGSSGLRWFGIRLPNEQALGAAADRVRAAGGSLEERDDGLLTHDPAHNGVLLMVG